jgi:helix-turn-helix protein
LFHRHRSPPHTQDRKVDEKDTSMLVHTFKNLFHRSTTTDFQLSEEEKKIARVLHISAQGMHICLIYSPYY